MKVHAQFYAQLRNAAGCSEIDVDVAENGKVSEFLEKIYERFPALRPHDKAILVGVGVEFVDRSYTIKPGEEIAIMPPVQGG
jgi:molybdopterin converting factor small subunit